MEHKNIGTIGHVAHGGSNLAGTIARLITLEEEGLNAEPIEQTSPTAPDPATQNKPEPPRLTRQQRRQIERKIHKFATRPGSQGRRLSDNEREMLGWIGQKPR